MTEKQDPGDQQPSDAALVQVLQNHGINRRSLVKLLGVGGLAGGAGIGMAAGDRADLPNVAVGNDAPSEGPPEDDESWPQDNARPPIIHSHFGYSGTADDDVPNPLEPDETVELHVDDSKIDDSNLPDLTIEFGAFHFEPVGLHIDPDSIVKFDFHTPEHSVMAYHPDQERQQRVPDGVAAFSSTVNEHHGFWLYRFKEEGVYDLFCAPHAFGAMGMRIVVGDDPDEVVRDPAPPPAGGGRPPLPMMAALLGTGLPPDDPDIGHPKLDPDHIVEHGPIFIHDHSADEDELDEDQQLELDLEVTITRPSPT